MKLQEYQTKKLMLEQGVKIVKGGIAYTAKEASKVASILGGNNFIVKAQVTNLNDSAVFSSLRKGEVVSRNMHINNITEIEDISDFMLGNTLIDKKNQEYEVRKVYIEKVYQTEKTMYFCLMLDIKTQSLIVASSFDENRNNIVYEKISIASRPRMNQFRKIFTGLDLDEEKQNEFKQFLKSIYKALISLDALKIEIPELILTTEGQLLIKDLDVFFDDYALNRQQTVNSMIDLCDMTREQELAYKWQVRYIPFTGNIGVMTNGVGLGLALADMINICGGEIAHLIDIGWNANRFRIVKAFQLVLRSINVDGLIIYVYGGSLHCDEVAEGIIAAVKEMSLEIPLVVRLGGTNEDIAKNLLESSGLPIIIADDMASASDQIVKSVENLK